MSTLARTLALGEPEGYVRTFVDEGATMVAHLSEVLNARQRGSLDPPVPAHCLRKLLAATERDATGAAPLTVGLSEPLTGRELEVLVLIAAGESNRRIAQELFVGMGTVKTHINNIFRKLGARNRAQAIVRARQLNLY